MNVAFVPVYGYMACAWAGFAGYGVAMLLSYFVGQKKYKIDYNLKSIAFYTAIAGALFAVHRFLPEDNAWLSIGVGTLLLAVFAAVIVKKENLIKAIKR